MGSVELLRTAREAGLTVEVRGDKLRVVGPKQAERLALELLDRKTELMPLLRFGALYAETCGDGDSGDTMADSEPVGDAGPWARRAAALLGTVTDPDRRADLRELFEYRAGVCEYCGELSRDDAERMAFDELQEAMRLAGELS